MMRVTIVSRSWPPYERSGVSLSAFSHARILLQQGYEVAIIGSKAEVRSTALPVSNNFCISATGSGALYSPVRINRHQLGEALLKTRPDLVIVEAWQTALGDSAIDAAYSLDIPILMISHGISLHPYVHTVTQFIRSLAWLPYKVFKLPRLMRKLTAITALDQSSHSNRFYDRDLAKKLGIHVLPLGNFPVHLVQDEKSRKDRKIQILIIGYFSAVKNQIRAIYVLSKLPKGINCVFVGDRQGAYFNECKDLVKKLKLENRVQFKQDDECNIAKEISESAVVFSPSITEAMPMTLIEAMSCGTPFVATSVGAVPGFNGGVLANTPDEQVKAIKLLLDDADIWEKYSNAGKAQYIAEFTESIITKQLTEAVSFAIGGKSNIVNTQQFENKLIEG